jgi:nitroreductase
LGIAGLDALDRQDEIFPTKPYSAGRHSRTVVGPTLGLMDLDALLRRRRMHRSFADRPLDPEALERILARARRAPSAGHTQGWAFLVLEGADQVAGFWEHASDPTWRRAPTWPGLLRAPVIVVPLASQDAYLARYSEADKEAAGRATEAGWPVPYWLIDTAFATMLLLLGVTEEGLGALFFALHGDIPRLLERFGVPAGWQPLGAVAIGWPDGADTAPGSAARGRRAAEEVVHRGRW